MDAVSHAVIGAAIEVHKHLGPGLLERVYESCLARELDLRGLNYERQGPIALNYKGMDLGEAYRFDLRVEGKVIVEIKAVASLLPIHEAQLLTYLRLTGCRIGLLLNFHSPRLKDGLHRPVL